MTPFDGAKLTLAGVAVGELRIRRIGNSPIDMARIAILDENMNPVSLAIFSGFSQKTRKLIDDALRSMEQDYVELLKANDQSGAPTSDVDEDAEVDGIDFR